MCGHQAKLRLSKLSKPCSVAYNLGNRFVLPPGKAQIVKALKAMQHSLQFREQVCVCHWAKLRLSRPSKPCSIAYSLGNKFVFPPGIAQIVKALKTVQHSLQCGEQLVLPLAKIRMAKLRVVHRTLEHICVIFSKVSHSQIHTAWEASRACVATEQSSVCQSCQSLAYNNGNRFLLPLPRLSLCQFSEPCSIDYKMGAGLYC